MCQYNNFNRVDHYPAEYTVKCLENNIFDYKTCIEFHGFKKENLFTDKIKERYNGLETIKPLIQKCVNNNIDKTTCHLAKNKNEYIFPLDYFNEFNILFDKIKKQ